MVRKATKVSDRGKQIIAELGFEIVDGLPVQVKPETSEPPTVEDIVQKIRFHRRELRKLLGQNKAFSKVSA